MMRSMTGFGAGRGEAGAERVSVELKSVNHKFCEVKARVPRELSTLEAYVTHWVKERVARGYVEVTVKRESASVSGMRPVVDAALAKLYREAFATVAKSTGLPDAPTVADILIQPGVLRTEEAEVNAEALMAATERALTEALQGLFAMRMKEGAALVNDIVARLDFLSNGAQAIARISPTVVDEYRNRLRLRVEELARGVAVDPQRLAQEVTLFADRTDIAEELTRLSSHVSQFKSLLQKDEPAGRKLDFLVQEMNREINTTGSKSQHAEIAMTIVGMKTELERIREQVQNLE